LWEREYTYTNDPDAVNLFFHDPVTTKKFAGGEFEILRKPPEIMLAMRRLVYDNDHQAKDLLGRVKPRWQPRNNWSANDDAAPKVFRHNGNSGDTPEWLRYQHLIVERNNPLQVARDPSPELIRNFMGYNTGELAGRGSHQVDNNWVGDLMVETTVTVEAPQGELWLELSKGADRFQARFNFQDGTLSLWRISGGNTTELGKTSSVISKPGTYELRFANVDSRLTVWVDGKLPFEDAKGDEGRKEGGVDYTPWVPRQGDTTDPASDPNNYEPASAAVTHGAKLSVAHLQVWRDTYFTPAIDGRQATTTELRTMYVQPGHYLCLGDNSSESSDSRYWGLVPERLLLGRALVVYWPVWPFGHNRAGLIR
jgi:signal peptidase I